MAGDELLHTKQVQEQYGINAGTLRFWRSTRSEERRVGKECRL